MHRNRPLPTGGKKTSAQTPDHTTILEGYVLPKVRTTRRVNFTHHAAETRGPGGRDFFRMTAKRSTGAHRERDPGGPRGTPSGAHPSQPNRRAHAAGERDPAPILHHFGWVCPPGKATVDTQGKLYPARRRHPSGQGTGTASS